MRGKRFFASVALFAIMLTAMFAFAPVAEAGKPTKPSPEGTTTISYVALGDSLAVGLFDGYWWNWKGYVERFHDWLKTGPYSGQTVELTNLGKNGWKSTDLLNALMTDRTFQRAVKGADVITLDIGGNDLLQHRDHLWDETAIKNSRDLFALNFPKIIGRIRALNSQAKLLVMDFYAPEGQYHEAAVKWLEGETSDGAVVDIEGVGFNDIIRDECLREGSGVDSLALVYDHFRLHEAAEDWISTDDVHANTEGHKAIAYCFTVAYQSVWP